MSVAPHAEQSVGGYEVRDDQPHRFAAQKLGVRRFGTVQQCCLHVAQRHTNVTLGKCANRGDKHVHRRQTAVHRQFVRRDEWPNIRSAQVCVCVCVVATAFDNKE